MLKNLSRRSFLKISAMTAAGATLDWPKINMAQAAMGPKENYPVVVIGAGLGGLCSGAYLAREGIPVTVVEQHSIPGGYATSFDRAEGKFTFEVSLHGITVKNNSTERILKELDLYDKLEFVMLPEVYRLKTPDYEVVVPQRDPERYVRMLSELFPAETEGIQNIVQAMLDIGKDLRAYDRQGKFSKKVFKLLFPLQFRHMWHIRNQTLADFLDEHIKTPALKDILAGLWGYYGLPPSKLSGFYYANATGAYLEHGSFTIKIRSQTLSNALADTVETAGGELIYDTSAEKILTQNNQVRGVTLSDGRTLPARAVISNASGPDTFKRMLPPDTLPVDYMDRLSRYRPSISSFIVWLGLNRAIADKVPGFTTHVASGDGPENDYRRCMQGEIEKMSFSVSIFDNLFENYSAPGTTSVKLLVLCGYKPWKRFEADYRQGLKSAYLREKNHWADILIKRAEEKLIPGLASMIEVKEAATPLTNWRYTGNPQGAIYGFEQSMGNAYMNRIDNRTPVEGLYLASAWGDPGGGYTGTLRGGAETFEKIMTDWAKKQN